MSSSIYTVMEVTFEVCGKIAGAFNQTSMIYPCHHFTHLADANDYIMKQASASFLDDEESDLFPCWQYQPDFYFHEYGTITITCRDGSYSRYYIEKVELD